MPYYLYPYKITSCNSNYSRFKELAQSNDVIITNNPKKANAIYSSSLKKFMPIFNKYPKKRLIVFTHEPYWDLNRKKQMNYLGKKIRIINCYTGYYTNPFYYFPKNPQKLTILNPNNEEKQVKFNNTKIKSCILASYHQDLIGKTKESLCAIRNKIGMKGKDMDITHVYGKGWPRGYSRENSRGGKWKARKSDILENYYFNICFENSHIKNYVSEKFWDAIKNYNLPVYKGSKWIYKYFPKNSFIDYKDYKSHKLLLQTIKKMSYIEWCRRMNLCIETYNKLLNTVDKNTIKDDVFMKLIKATKG